jgi:hypothetical protein
MDLTGRRQPRHFSLVFPANVSQGDYILLFRNGQVLRCWPIEPPAGPVQGSEPGLTTFRRWPENLIRRSISVSNKARSRRSRKNRLGERDADPRIPPSHAAIADECMVKHKIE